MSAGTIRELISQTRDGMPSCTTCRHRKPPVRHRRRVETCRRQPLRKLPQDESMSCKKLDPMAHRSLLPTFYVFGWNEGGIIHSGPLHEPIEAYVLIRHSKWAQLTSTRDKSLAHMLCLQQLAAPRVAFKPDVSSAISALHHGFQRLYHRSFSALPLFHPDRTQWGAKSSCCSINGPLDLDCRGQRNSDLLCNSFPQ